MEDFWREWIGVHGWFSVWYVDKGGAENRDDGERNSMVSFVVDVTYIFEKRAFEHWDIVRSSVLIVIACRAAEFTW